MKGILKQIQEKEQKQAEEFEALEGLEETMDPKDETDMEDWISQHTIVKQLDAELQLLESQRDNLLNRAKKHKAQQEKAEVNSISPSLNNIRSELKTESKAKLQEIAYLLFADLSVGIKDSSASSGKPSEYPEEDHLSKLMEMIK